MSIINNTEKNSLANYLLNESEELLEWYTLKKQLSTFSSTPMGEKAILKIEIPRNFDLTKRLLEETVEINNLERENDQKLDFKGIFDIKRNIKLCSKGGILNSFDLLNIADTIASSIRIKKIIFNPEIRPLLSSLVNKIIDHKQLLKILKSSIENNGRISDDASETLYELRKKLKSIRDERRKILESFVHKNSVYLQDTVIGDRYGRPVLPIKVNYLNRVKGIIHDSSSSGNTIFIEPEAVIPKGNQIASINAKIASEEYKLLRKWSNIISDNKETLTLTSDILLQLENALTRSRYSDWIKGKPPKFDQNFRINIIGFRHPLLIWESQKNNSINPKSIDFFINKEVRVVSITGPNTGGKTAALKGLGIAILMSKIGLFIPSNQIPTMPFFSYIYADIGDNQSLEGNLSTFSGHIKRIKNILDVLESKKGLSMVLLDEIGSGTDPEEGSALALSLLKEFANKSDLTIATTHYGELKTLKYKDPRFENVSVSFDEESLKPIYSLNWGIPGRSNALSIAKRIGLNQSIINQAAEHLKPKETENINKVIQGLEEQRERQQKAAEQAAALIARTEILYDELNRNYQFQKLKALEFQAKEKERLTKSIKKAKSEVIKLIEKLRNKNATGEDSRKIGIRIKEIENAFFSEEKITEEYLSWQPKLGEMVRIKSLNSHGKVIALDDKNQSFTVNCGSFNSILPISDLQGINGEKPKINRSKILINSAKDNYSYSKVRTSKNTIDVRGLRVHEAEIVIEEKIRRFHGPLWIIHGIGTGKLKKGLKSWLIKLDYVDKIEDASSSEGGSGCSIVWIK
ncbi:MAG: endonuclease MutS2 [Prochlorococcus sp. SP3034]|nr:endonuclease MutS2 [Prochlorococcus sp. SP3034]|tara:strand:- start:1934 stop:4348 length:2415 start_codon:yes stop_codon:yes gene_type:complete